MRIIATLAFFLSCSHLFSQTTLFVNQNVSGGQQNGSNWTNAFPDLQQALAIATDGDMIWVATGTYFPTSGDDRSISFVLKQGVALLGGFLGTEAEASERDFLTNETKLSGNIGFPQGSDNSFHVLRGEGLDSTTVVDGFVISHGIADSPGEHGSGGGLLLTSSTAVINTCPLIQNCRFEQNFAIQGGAISCDRNDNYYINPIIRNCQFYFNRAATSGGGISKTGPALADQPFVMENCIFANNSCLTGNGGGVYMAKMEYETRFIGCSFVQDSSKFGAGAGFYFDSGYDGYDGNTIIFETCIFSKNIAPEGAGLMIYGFTIADVNTPPLSISFSYCIFEKNVATNGIGAAYFIYGFNQINLNVDVFGCKFMGNQATNTPISYIQGDAKSNVKIQIESCEYYGNKRLGNPDDNAFPIIYGLGGSQGKLDAVIKNCLFSGNGGGISSVCSSSGGKMNTLIDNCTFYNNSGFIINKSFFFDFDGITKYVRTTVRNCVIWEPAANLWTMFGDNNSSINILSGYNVDHCLLSLDSFAASPFGNHNITHHEPLFVDAANGDLRLLPCSPAVNAGENLVVDTLNLMTDLDGNPRIAHGVVDMGAYEAVDSCFVSGSYEPPESEDQAMIFPNPVPAGQRFEVKASGFSSPETHWMIWDMKGAEISTGTELLANRDRISLPSPKIPGIYFLKLWDREHAVVLKFEAL